MSEFLSAQDCTYIAEQRVWILDVDDCLYRIASGLHDQIKTNIVETWNAMPADEPQTQAIKQAFDRIVQEQGFTTDSTIQMEENALGTAFPAIVQALQETVSADEFGAYMNAFYGDAYDLITPDPDLVEAIDIARNKGIEVYLYTNGPSSQDSSEDFHVQKVLAALGFQEEAIATFRENTYDLLMSIEKGRGKPTAESFEDFLDHFDINPDEAVMFDDGMKNLKTAAQYGVLPVWTWTTSDQEPSSADQLSAYELGVKRTPWTGSTALDIAHKVPTPLIQSNAPAF